MSSTPSSSEPEIISVARDKADYIKAEMMAEFKRFEAGETQLTPPGLKIFEDKWAKELSELENRIFTVNLSPETQPFAPALEKTLKELKGFMDMYLKALKYHYVPEGSAAPPEDAEDEKARKRAERKARMEKFKRGEKPD